MDAVIVMGFYHDPRLRTALHALKYRGGTVLVPDIVQAVQGWKGTRALPWEGTQDLVVQPLLGTPRRVRERGFDQARLLADALAHLLTPSAVVADLLVRRDADMAQALIDRPELRHANIAGMFTLKDAPMPKGAFPKNVLLIDDVVTTGATMAEAARVLRAAGVTRVYGFAVALGK